MLNSCFVRGGDMRRVFREEGRHHFFGLLVRGMGYNIDEWSAIYLPIYLSIYLPIYLPTYLPSYLPAYLPTYLPTYLPCYGDSSTWPV